MTNESTEGDRLSPMGGHRVLRVAVTSTEPVTSSSVTTASQKCGISHISEENEDVVVKGRASRLLRW